MKQIFSIVSAIVFLSCNNQTSNANGNADSTIRKVSSKNEAVSGGGCSNNLLFRKGAVIDATTYDGNGKVLGLQSSTVMKVYDEKGMTVSETDVQSTNAEGKDENVFKIAYKCDGDNFIMDMASLAGNAMQGTTISASGLSFPFILKAGQTLPDASHTISIASGGKNMKIISVIKDRKVEARESITIPAGEFEAYKISAVIDATTEMEGITEEMKKSMQAIKKRMGENRFIIWYAPELTVLKMEMYMGDKLQSRTEVTKIKR
ncbi:MAG TPA: hypothetical protein VJ111_06395 [Chitinophagaceae bacterium]|nr:hypothetical protein [Chitinophagaceae bacterium]